MLVFALFGVHFYNGFQGQVYNMRFTLFSAPGRNLRRKYDEETDRPVFKIRKEKEKYTAKRS